MGSCTGDVSDSSHTTHSGLYVSGPACVCESTCSSDAQNHCELDSQLLERKQVMLEELFTYSIPIIYDLCAIFN